MSDTEQQAPKAGSSDTDADHEPSRGMGSTFVSQVRRREPARDPEEPPVLIAEDFSVYYEDFQAVRNISMEIRQGEVTAIIGPSGCGKSTFLNAMNRMVDLIPGCHTTGKLIVDGQDIYERGVDVVLLRRRIGMVFQKPNPFPKSIYDNIAYGPRLHGERNRSRLDEIVERSLQEAGLWNEVKDRLEHNAMGLSGGQQQRLCIARALAIEPHVVLLDEPTSALDPKSTSRIEDLVDSLRGRYSIIMVTHNMQQAARVSDYTAFLYEGDLIEFGETAGLFTKPEKKQTEDYITGRFG